MEERATREDLEAKVVQLEGVREQAERERDEHREVAERERDSSRGLQQVLEEFQACEWSNLCRLVFRHYTGRTQHTPALESVVC